MEEGLAGEAIIFDLSGRLILDESSNTFRYTIRRLLEEGKKNIVVNLPGIRQVDSSGPGNLISSLTAIKKGDGTMNVVGPT